MSIETNLLQLNAQLPANVVLVAVSKKKSAAEMMEAYRAGQRHFGENYVQELLAKQLHMPADTIWHFIGHLQRNKVKQLAPFAHWVHAVDSIRLLDEIEKQFVLCGRQVQCLLQVHVAREETKFGWEPDELLSVIHSLDLSKYRAVVLRGLMAMASFTDDTATIRLEFMQVQSLFNRLKESAFAGRPQFDTLSMGMSSDWPVAVQCGSNMVRIGSAIFGERT